MGREYLVSGSRFEMQNRALVLKGKRSQAGPEIELRIPIDVLLSLAMHARRAERGHHARGTAQPENSEWKLVHALPIHAAQVHSTPDQTMGACLLVFDPGTDVELQLSLPTVELVRKLGEALIECADQKKDQQGLPH